MPKIVEEKTARVRSTSDVTSFHRSPLKNDIDNSLERGESSQMGISGYEIEGGTYVAHTELLDCLGADGQHALSEYTKYKTPIAYVQQHKELTFHDLQTMEAEQHLIASQVVLPSEVEDCANRRFRIESSRYVGCNIPPSKFDIDSTPYIPEISHKHQHSALPVPLVIQVGREQREYKGRNNNSTSGCTVYDSTPHTDLHSPAAHCDALSSSNASCGGNGLRRSSSRCAHVVNVLGIPHQQSTTALNFSGQDTPYLYGGVDVSFATDNSNGAVAVYVVTNSLGDVVYSDSQYFQLTIPYISSFLAFREIDTLELLVKRQLETRPECTPEVVLVDGNGVLHVRSAGIACVLGVRTGVPTVGVAKKFYCVDGLTKIGVEDTLRVSLLNFWNNNTIDSSGQRLAKVEGSTTAVVLFKGNCAAVLHAAAEISEAAVQGGGSSTDAHDNNSTESGKRNEEIRSVVTQLHKHCSAFAVELQGDSGRIWGAALIGHGGRKPTKRAHGTDVPVFTRGAGTKMPIYISVGHKVSLPAAIKICADLSVYRIPEPVRIADLEGREILRRMVKRNVEL
eukprot:Lankesteria_metandrocarpae@DN3553_c0_g1_i1.p1